MTDLERLQELMQNGIAYFSYTKKDGTIRRAFGTLKHIPKYNPKDVDNLFEKSRDFLVGYGTGTLIKGDDDALATALSKFNPKPAKEKKESEYITYYDLESEGFRMFHPDKFLAILNTDVY